MKPISLAEPVSDLRSVRIREIGEPLVDFSSIPGLLIGRSRLDYHRETVVRKSVAERLATAVASLPAGYKLGIIEGWRAPLIQRRMYAAVWNRFKEANPDWSDVRLRRTVNRFTAPMNAQVPPPHTTGGAIDVELLDADGNPHDVVSPFERFDVKCFAFEVPGLSDHARHNRMVLWSALTEAGITNYPSEFWHYSYGDQGWAYRGGHPHALYGPITPPNWAPDPRDDIDAPLVFLETQNK